MRRLGARRFRQTLEWFAGIIRPFRREALLLASLLGGVAASEAFAGLYLKKLSDMADVPHHLPEIRCLDQAAKRP
jgi:hypothetical protein